MYASATPHAGFAALGDLAGAAPAGHFVVTSNVDGLFQKAGFDPERVVEVHGSLARHQCSEQRRHGTWPAPAPAPAKPGTLARAAAAATLECTANALPKCRAHRCRAIARPNILLFHDTTFHDSRTTAQRELFSRWLGRFLEVGVAPQPRRRVVVIEAGAGRAVRTIRDVTERVLQDGLAAGADVGLVRINIEPDPSGSGAECGLDIRRVYVQSDAQSALVRIAQAVHTVRNNEGPLGGVEEVAGARPTCSVPS